MCSTIPAQYNCKASASTLNFWIDCLGDSIGEPSSLLEIVLLPCSANRSSPQHQPHQLLVRRQSHMQPILAAVPVAIPPLWLPPDNTARCHRQFDPQVDSFEYHRANVVFGLDDLRKRLLCLGHDLSWLPHFNSMRICHQLISRGISHTILVNATPAMTLCAMHPPPVPWLGSTSPRCGCSSWSTDVSGVLPATT